MSRTRQASLTVNLMRDDPSAMSINPDAASETEEILGLENRGDRWATWVLGTPLTLVVAGLCVLMLMTWIPHYLTWPWWVDLEDYAYCAQAWDSGILPYRDIAAYSFPGQTYLFWVLGKTFGWGRTVPIYALDAGLVILLGIALLGWSRRVFGWYLPGLIGYASFLWYYLNLDFSLVAHAIGTPRSSRSWRCWVSRLSPGGAGAWPLPCCWAWPSPSVLTSSSSCRRSCWPSMREPGLREAPGPRPSGQFWDGAQRSRQPSSWPSVP